MAGLLHFVECFGDVKPCFAQECGQAFHLYADVFLAFGAVAAHCYETCYAAVDGRLVVAPDVVCLLLCFVADDVEEVEAEDAVVAELAKKVLLAEMEHGALSTGCIAAFVGGVVAKERIGLYCRRGCNVFCDAVGAVGRFACAGGLALGEYGKLLAAFALGEDGLAVVVVLELERYFAQNGCYVVLAHTLEVGQAQKRFVHCLWFCFLY